MNIILKNWSTCLILKVLPRWIYYYWFCTHIQSLVELESVIVATAPYFEHTAPLTYSLCSHSALWNRILENLLYCNKINVHMYIVHEKMAGNFNMQLHSLCKAFKMVSRWVLTDNIYIYINILPNSLLESHNLLNWSLENSFVCFFLASIFLCFERQSNTFYLVLIWMTLFSCILYIKATVKQWVNIKVII